MFFLFYKDISGEPPILAIAVPRILGPLKTTSSSEQDILKASTPACLSFFHTKESLFLVQIMQHQSVAGDR